MGALVIAVYRARPGSDQRLAELVARHLPALRSEGLVTGRAGILARSAVDGSWLEIFEWKSEEHSRRAHDNPVVRELWRQMGVVAEFPPLQALAEAAKPFAHFEPVDGSLP